MATASTRWERTPTLDSQFSIQPCTAETPTKFKTLRAMRMSVDTCTHPDNDDTDQDILHCLSEHANLYGYAYPGNGTILEWCRLRRRPIKLRALHYRLRNLVARELIE